MRLAQFELEAPKTMRAACRLLEGQGGAAHIIAGGTDLLTAMKDRLKNPGLLVLFAGLCNTIKLAAIAAKWLWEGKPVLTSLGKRRKSGKPGNRII